MEEREIESVPEKLIGVGFVEINDEDLPMIMKSDILLQPDNIDWGACSHCWLFGHGLPRYNCIMLQQFDVMHAADKQCFALGLG